MGYTKRLVCLANSAKPRGSCIAGIELTASGYGGWIRPVSSRPKAELGWLECLMEGGLTPRPLDIIDVPFLHHSPHNHQVENHVIDSKGTWIKQGELPFSELARLATQPDSLWSNTDRTQSGSFDCMHQDKAWQQHGALLLIEQANLTFIVSTNDFAGRRRHRLLFNYNHYPYNFSLTDPLAKEWLEDRDDGEYRLPENPKAYLCLSLTEPYTEDMRCHKLVAAVLKNPPLGA